MDIFIGVLSRCLHIGSAVFLVGAAMYGRWMVTPAAGSLEADGRQKLNDGLAAAFRPAALVAILALAASGLYNLMTKQAVPSSYWMWFGVKALLALHIIAVSLLLGKTGVDGDKRGRWMTGIAMSGLAIMAISAYLRTLTA